MKHFLSILLGFLIGFCFVGCDSANIEVGTKDGVAYFHHFQSSPEIIMTGEGETKINDAAFLEKLIAAIDGKAAVNDFCNCEALYNIRIDQYTFGLHTHGITVTWPMGHNIKGFNVFTVDCTEDEINALFSILDSIK